MVSRAGRGLSLKGISVILLAAVTVYATAMMVFLTLQLGRIATDMREGVEPGRFLYEEVVSRVHILTGAAFSVGQILVGDPSGDSLAVANLRGQLLGYFTDNEFPPLDQLAPDTRESLVLAQGHANSLQSTVHEVMDLIELGRREEAAAGVRRMDSLRVLFDAQLTRAQLEGIRNLQSRQEALADSSRQAVRALALWLVVGLIGIPVIWFVVRQRIWQPLARLEEGLSLVAQGDLHVEVAVRRHDEVGRLADHFNSMTAVLRQRAEAQGRFAAAGELIAGVAHEVNNPLMAIAAMGEARLEDDSLPAEQRSELQHIVRQARRAGRLLSGLLRFVRTDDSGLVSADLSEVCRDALELASYRFNQDDVTLDASLGSDLPSASGDPARIEQVVVNILGNALDALQGIELPRRIAVTTYATADAVCLAVEDNGPGVPAEIHERLFHPFTTTKGKGGTGLGLYISRQIVRDLGGDLTFVPTPRGAKFVLSLPPSSVPADPALTRSPPRALVRPRLLTGMCVLLVEDEEGIRQPMARYLASRGARTLEAGNGLEALELLGQHDVDALVVDLKMPRMDGQQLYTALLARDPELAARTLTLTGDLGQIQDGSGADVDPANILIKPVRLSEVEDRLQRLWLDAHGPATPDAGGRTT
jgi:signal transduction histidine kinase/CheY-like chemotaxis protein